MIGCAPAPARRCTHVLCRLLGQFGCVVVVPAGWTADHGRLRRQAHGASLVVFAHGRAWRWLISRPGRVPIRGGAVTRRVAARAAQRTAAELHRRRRR